MVDGIREGLRWLGLNWDEGPFFQSERLPLYREVVARLLASGKAYRDFAPAGSEERAHCRFRDLPAEESDRLAASGAEFAVRFRVPPGMRVSFDDLVFGRVEVDTEEIEDFVILRSDGNPTYHLSVVADDIDMSVSHVIRGADHLSNTSKHVLLYGALEAAVPVYAHLPLILGPDKKRLSKRHGATSVTEYMAKGLLPGAVRNHLALLGWSPGDDTEFMHDEELIRRFDVGRINRANAVFDFEKLDWMNKRWLSAMPGEALAPLVEEELRRSGVWPEVGSPLETRQLVETIDLLKTRVGSLLDFPVYGKPFFSGNFEYEADAVSKYLMFPDAESRSRMAVALQQLIDGYSALAEFDLASTEALLREIAAQQGLKAGQFIGAVRVAMTGRLQAPGIFEVLVTLGKAEVLARLRRVLTTLEDPDR